MNERHDPPPPENPSLSLLERAAWDHAAPKLRRLGLLPDAYQLAFSLFIQTAVTYLLAPEEAERAQRDATDASSWAATEEMHREAAEWRTLARQQAARFGLLPSQRAGLALVDSRGDDVELKRLLGLTDDQLDAGYESDRRVVDGKLP